MVQSVLSKELGVTFELTYPVAGHSFLPADRLFGRLEKILRKHDTLLTPDDYLPLFSSVAQVRQLNQDWYVQSFNAATKNLLRCRQNFKLSQVKRLRVRAGGVIECSDTYTGDLQEHCLAKDRKNVNLFRLRRVPRSSSAHKIKREKLNDVKKLLGKSGINSGHPSWPFFDHLFSLHESTTAVDDSSSRSSTSDE